MIQIYNTLKDIANYLDKYKNIDYRLYLKTNNKISVYILGDQFDLENFCTVYSNENIEIEFYTSTSEEYEYIKDIFFSKTNKINTFDSDRRLVSLLDDTENIISKNIPPIFTFYSYKGGVGRSTTLASCATYLSYHHSLKIVIIDCDFEAPGFVNYFLEDPETPLYSNGVVEYLLDKDFNGKDVNVRNYLWEASKEYSGKGEIYIMPSGNLNDNNGLNSIPYDRDHYLKGLARLDFSEKKIITTKFNDLISDIVQEISPDLILLDSRTGFNDIFGITAFQLSNVVIGFFGNNIQTMPGLHFFIESLFKRKNITGLIVNSIISPTNKRKWHKTFQENVESYINEIVNTEEDPIALDVFAISRNEILESVGTVHSDKLDFIDLIHKKEFGDINELSQKLLSLFQDFKTPQLTPEEVDIDIIEVKNDVIKSTEEEKYQIEEEQEGDSKHKLETVNNMEENEIAHLIQHSPILGKKLNILRNTLEKMPELYAEEIKDFEEEFTSGKYFYRNCMLDLFNLDKFLVLGNKGTGKTYIYRSLKNDSIVKELQKKANKSDIEFKFIHSILKDKYFIDTTKFDGELPYTSDKFFERFWQIYIWNVLVNELSNEINFIPSITPFEIKDNIETSIKFKELIMKDELMISIEKDLDNIDSELSKKSDKNIIIIFDELDHVVKPYAWSDRVAPLLNLCKKFSYKRIYPKLFLRSDLFEKISNVNNVQALSNKAINIEWTCEELFAYFFKQVISHSKNLFFDIMKDYNDYPSFHINKIRASIEKNDGQPELDEYFLRHLTTTYFGKYADISNTPRFGESYDWFYKNLKNSNDTISLRPFLDLLSEAIKYALKEDHKEKPILSQFYYTHGSARGKAVENHFLDLANEKGNEDLTHIFHYIKDQADPKYKVLELQQKDFYELLDQIIIKFGDRLNNKTKESIIELLKVNGIVQDRFLRRGIKYNAVQKRYQFALLYKYYLGLKNKSRNNKFYDQ